MKMKTPINKTVAHILLDHIDHPRPFVAGVDYAAILSLHRRGFIRFDGGRRHTIITALGREEAARILGIIAERACARALEDA